MDMVKKTAPLSILAAFFLRGLSAGPETETAKLLAFKSTQYMLQNLSVAYDIGQELRFDETCSFLHLVCSVKKEFEIAACVVYWHKDSYLYSLLPELNEKAKERFGKGFESLDEAEETTFTKEVGMERFELSDHLEAFITQMGGNPEDPWATT